MARPSSDIGKSDLLQHIKNKSIDTEQLLSNITDNIVGFNSTEDELKIARKTDMGGSEIWSFSIGGNVYSSPVVVDGVVYVGSNDDNLYAVDASDGSEIWSFSTGGNVYSSPVVVDGVVYVGSYDDNLYAVDASDGSEIWSYSTGNSVYSSPVVVDGVVYVGSNDNSLYAVDAVERFARLYIADEYGWIPLYKGPNENIKAIGSTQTGDIVSAGQSRTKKQPVSFPATKSGDGSTTTFTINHPLGEIPRAVYPQPTSADANGNFYITNKTASSFDIVYESAPANGTDNLSWDIEVKP